MSDHDFHPHLLLRSGHAQTLAAFWLFGRTLPERATQQLVTLDDGDQLVLHDDCPPDWTAGQRIALLVHGVCGCHASPYVSRVARRLNDAGIRTFRLDLRGCGAGLSLARKPYHGGCSPDLLAAVKFAVDLCPASSLAAIGFSLGGNILLKMLGEAPELVPAELDRAAAVNPPIDLLLTSRRLTEGARVLYDRYFARLLWSQFLARRGARPDLVTTEFRRPRTLWEFDDRFTAPLAGFGHAENYYRQCSSALHLEAIRVPTLIVSAADDPIVPVESFQSARVSPAVTVRLTESGGHLGYIARRNADPDRHWLDWRLVEWASQA